MRQFQVTGMTCAACSARVEKAVRGVPGVTECAVSLLTNSMGVEGTAADAAIIAAVEKAGYGAKSKDAAPAPSAAEDALRDRDTPVLKKRLLWSIGFLALLMYLSMGHMMAGWPVPKFLEPPVAQGIAQMLLAGIIMVINQKFFISGFRGLLHRSPNMDTLVALGAAAAFGYSACMLLLMAGAEGMAVHEYLHELYFESAGTILTLITVGKMLEARSKGKTTDALKSLMRLAPQTATIVTEQGETQVPIAQVKQGDVFAVRPGETIPVDGVILEGQTAVNEAALTGESVPADKGPGDTVSAATINQAGFIRCRATRVGEDTTLSQIIRMVSDAAATKAPIAKIADKVSGIFVPTVIGIALVTFAAWMLLGETLGFALARAISVLVISCPCALGLATPVAIMVGSGVGAKNGILFKTAASLEAAGRVEIVALDKTGTLTAGEPRTTDLLPAEGISEKELLRLAASLERQSEHPLAKAVLAKAQEAQIPLMDPTEFEALPGHGLKGKTAEGMLYGGNQAHISGRAKIPESAVQAARNLANQGKTPLFFARNDQFLGIIAVADTLKPDSAQAVQELRSMGVRTVMLTGDNERTARAIGAEAGVDEVIAGVLPGGKADVIAALKKQGRTAMVGDGINDAPALTSADLGMAIGAGADVAIDAADVVLMRSQLSDVPAAIRLSRATLRNIRENLFWAFFYNSIGIPLAAGVFISLLGWKMNPMFGAAAMGLSSFCVVTNALRLNFVKIHDARHDHKRRGVAVTPVTLPQEAPVIRKTMKVEGMMCGHCEATVKAALEAIPGVRAAAASHETGLVQLEMTGAVEESLLREAVEKEDYAVLEIRDEA